MANSEINGLRNIVEATLAGPWPGELNPGYWTGKIVRFPIRKRSAWDDAIKWLEAHEAAKKEWPWP